MNTPKNVQINDDQYTTPLGDIPPGTVVYLPQFPGVAMLRMAADDPNDDTAMLARLHDGAELNLPAIWKAAPVTGTVVVA